MQKMAHGDVYKYFMYLIENFYFTIRNAADRMTHKKTHTIINIKKLSVLYQRWFYDVFILELMFAE